MNSSILSLLIFLPVMGVMGMLIVALLGKQGLIKTENKDVYKYIALAVTGVQMLLAFFLYANFDPTLSVTQSPFCLLYTSPRPRDS